MTRPTRYPPELRERAVRLVREHRDEHPSEWAAIESIAEKLGMTPETLAQVAAAGRGRRRPAAGRDQRRARAAQGAGAGEPGAAAGERDPEGGVGFSSRRSSTADRRR